MLTSLNVIHYTILTLDPEEPFKQPLTSHLFEVTVEKSQGMITQVVIL